MITLCIRYSFNPDRLGDFTTYVEAELGPIARSGGRVLGYFLPTDFAGPTDEAMGLIEFETLAAYEHYRRVLGADPEHQRNVAQLMAAGASVAMSRSFIRRA